MSVTISVIVTSEQELIYICSGMHEIDCLSSVDVVSSLSGKACNTVFSKLEFITNWQFAQVIFKNSPTSSGI